MDAQSVFPTEHNYVSSLREEELYNKYVFYSNRDYSASKQVYTIDGPRNANQKGDVSLHDVIVPLTS